MFIPLIVFLSSANLICRSTDISKCFIESLGVRDNESRLYFFLTILIGHSVLYELEKKSVENCDIWICVITWSYLRMVVQYYHRHPQSQRLCCPIQTCLLFDRNVHGSDIVWLSIAGTYSNAGQGLLCKQMQKDMVQYDIHELDRVTKIYSRNKCKITFRLTLR